MKDIQSVEGLKNIDIFDVENMCKFYKFAYVPTLELLDVIDIDNYIKVEYEISNYRMEVKWNIWKSLFTINILQDDQLIRVIENGITNDTALIYNPEFIGSYFKLIFLFDMKTNKRPLYIYKTYDIMEGY
jgi:hypothetical protein